MAQLDYSRKSWWSAIPLIGMLAPDAFTKNVTEKTDSLKVKTTERTDAALRGIFGLDEFSKSCGPVTGDHLVIDTGEELVDIKADNLDLVGVKKGDKVEFKLDDALDPAGATKVKGKVLIVADGNAPSEAQKNDVHAASDAKGKEVLKPLDTEDPISDLVSRRALLFQEFKHGNLDQDSLKDNWDALRKQAVSDIANGPGSKFLKENRIQEMLDIGAFTEAEAVDYVQTVNLELGPKDRIPG